MNKKKLSGAIGAVTIILSFLLFLFGEINYFIFLGVAISLAIFAFKIMPKIK
jgi:hypothetical protein